MYLVIKTKCPNISSITVYTGGKPHIFYDRSKNIVNSFPNILYTYNNVDDIVMGIKELIPTGNNKFCSIDDDPYLFGANPKQISEISTNGYLQSPDPEESLLNRMVELLGSTHAKSKIVIFNSTCLFSEETLDLPVMFYEWSLLFIDELRLGPIQEAVRMRHGVVSAQEKITTNMDHIKLLETELNQRTKTLKEINKAKHKLLLELDDPFSDEMYIALEKNAGAVQGDNEEDEDNINSKRNLISKLERKIEEDEEWIESYTTQFKKQTNIGKQLTRIGAPKQIHTKRYRKKANRYTPYGGSKKKKTKKKKKKRKKKTKMIRKKKRK